jgi:hypothetical protein
MEETCHTPFQFPELLLVIQAKIQDVDMQYIIFQMDRGRSGQEADYPDEDHLGHRVKNVQAMDDEPRL